MIKKNYFCYVKQYHLDRNLLVGDDQQGGNGDIVRPHIWHVGPTIMIPLVRWSGLFEEQHGKLGRRIPRQPPPATNHQHGRGGGAGAGSREANGREPGRREERWNGGTRHEARGAASNATPTLPLILVAICLQFATGTSTPLSPLLILPGAAVIRQWDSEQWAVDILAYGGGGWCRGGVDLGLVPGLWHWWLIWTLAVQILNCL